MGEKSKITSSETSTTSKPVLLLSTARNSPLKMAVLSLVMTASEESPDKTEKL